MPNTAGAARHRDWTGDCRGGRTQCE